MASRAKQIISIIDQFQKNDESITLSKIKTHFNKKKSKKNHIQEKAIQNILYLKGYRTLKRISPIENSLQTYFHKRDVYYFLKDELRHLETSNCFSHSDDDYKIAKKEILNLIYNFSINGVYIYEYESIDTSIPKKRHYLNKLQISLHDNDYLEAMVSNANLLIKESNLEIETLYVKNNKIIVLSDDSDTLYYIYETLAGMRMSLLFDNNDNIKSESKKTKIPFNISYSFEHQNKKYSKSNLRLRFSDYLAENYPVKK